ncbi:MAG TPA: UDP-N-acetylmuramoyl-tripeptide--D-alanyl-D-alanine ligase, partial [Cytophagales bacterium]|nr:UDP-N-acetylmuramoyl-tripeptide--D-alanyl-D-alanine ligase [Cytophagales bacterium]
ATAYRKQLSIPVLAITGSNGKTTTKELITLVLAQKYKVYATQGNLNNHIGVPLTILAIPPDCQLAIIELGANHLQEIEELCEIAEPDYGLITNCGMDHLEGYGSLEAVIQGNTELYDYLKAHDGLAFVHKDDEILQKQAQGMAKKEFYPDQARIINNDFYITASYKEQFTIKSQLIGDFNFINIACALKIGDYFKVPDAAAVAAIESYVPKNNRSQVVEKNGVRYILDAYNANPSSMELALKSFAQIKAAKKAVILGDMFEMGDFAASEHRRMVALATALPFDQVVFCGEEFERQSTEKGLYFKDRASLKAWFDQQDLQGYTILMKGSRGMALEKLLDN